MGVLLQPANKQRGDAASARAFNCRVLPHPPYPSIPHPVLRAQFSRPSPSFPYREVAPPPTPHPRHFKALRNEDSEHGDISGRSRVSVSRRQWAWRYPEPSLLFQADLDATCRVRAQISGTSPTFEACVVRLSLHMGPNSGFNDLKASLLTQGPWQTPGLSSTAVTFP